MADKKSDKRTSFAPGARDNAQLTTTAPDDYSFDRPSFVARAQEEANASSSEEASGSEVEDGPRVAHLLKSATTQLFGIPLGFFTSREQLRTWGEERLADPAVQPHEKMSRPPAFFPSVLPGYPEKSYLTFGTADMPFSHVSSAPPGGMRLRAPSPTHYKPPVSTTSHRSSAELVPPIGYNWKELESYQMDYQPYHNALMMPARPDGMYTRGDALVAYPYGVPAVEENEQGLLGKVVASAPRWCC